MATTNRAKNDWITLLQRANVRRGDEIPKGFYPVEHWLEEFEISESTWKRYSDKLEKQGVFVREYFRVSDRSGRVLKKPFWRRK